MRNESDQQSGRANVRRHKEQLYEKARGRLPDILRESCGLDNMEETS
jgi:hypothetical protein